MTDNTQERDIFIQNYSTRFPLRAIQEQGGVFYGETQEHYETWQAARATGTPDGDCATLEENRAQSFELGWEACEAVNKSKHADVNMVERVARAIYEHQREFYTLGSDATGIRGYSVEYDEASPESQANCLAKAKAALDVIPAPSVVGEDVDMRLLDDAITLITKSLAGMLTDSSFASPHVEDHRPRVPSWVMTHFKHDYQRRIEYINDIKQRLDWIRNATEKARLKHRALIAAGVINGGGSK